MVLQTIKNMTHTKNFSTISSQGSIVSLLYQAGLIALTKDCVFVKRLKLRLPAIIVYFLSFDNIIVRL